MGESRPNHEPSDPTRLKQTQSNPNLTNVVDRPDRAQSAV